MRATASERHGRAWIQISVSVGYHANTHSNLVIFDHPPQGGLEGRKSLQESFSGRRLCRHRLEEGRLRFPQTPTTTQGGKAASSLQFATGVQHIHRRVPTIQTDL